LVGVQFVEESAVADEADEAAGGEGSAAESKEEELVSRFIVVHDESVGLVKNRSMPFSVPTSLS
jgi:hypothetical protein